MTSSLPATPSEDRNSVFSVESLQSALDTTAPTSPMASPSQPPGSPLSPTSPPTTPFRRGHGRQASLGTTMTSPSTRRRSIESTMSMIQSALDGKDKAIPELSEFAESLTNETTKKNGR
jgi:serine/threonine-protein phosphatase 2B catalytic subunit